MMRAQRLICVGALLGVVAAQARAAKLDIIMDGLSDELAAAVRSNLTLQNYTSRDVTSGEVRRLLPDSSHEIKTSLEPYGYYNVVVSSRVISKASGLTATFQVTLGEPVKVDRVNVQVRGEALARPAVARAIQRFRPRTGDVLDHGRYEASKDALAQALLNEGFLRAAATRHRVEVSRAANTAAVDLEFDSGPRMRYGPVRFHGSQFRPDFLQRFVPWKAHDFYSPEEVLQLQQRLVDADYFATVSVQPDLTQVQQLEVPIDVEVAPAKRTVYTAGVYVSTDTGPGAKVGMQRRWINDRGHKLNVDLDIAQRVKSIGTTYSIPLPGPNERSLNFGVSYRDENTDTSKARTERILANESRTWRGWTRTIGLQSLNSTFKVADEYNTSKLLFAEATLSKKKVNDLFFPRKGFSLAFGLRSAPESVFSDTSFTQGTLDAKWIRSLSRRDRLLIRASLGALAVQKFDALPPELRFFAGGDRSIRGFDYQALGTTNSAGKVIGGTYLTVGSVEIEHYFWREWGAALFVDGGDAFRTGEFDLNLGAGLGLRWRSPVGVVRVDVAKPVKSDLAHSIRLHISIGADL